MRTDDDLTRFEAEGAEPLPPADLTATLEHDGARIAYASHGAGHPVVLLHGGLGHSGNWGGQVPGLVAAGYRVILIDSRGHGRSTRDGRPFRYETMAGDVLAVLDALAIERAAFVGWSDGACVALILAAIDPSRVTGVFFFACNMDPSGTRPFEMTPLIARCFERHRRDYTALSATPDDFPAFVEAVGLMQATQPDWSAADLARVAVPIVVALGEHDEFIERSHAEYLARTMPEAQLLIIPGAGHFAPVQRPDAFTELLLRFLSE
jgi:non-heme chloroperoxidase